MTTPEEAATDCLERGLPIDIATRGWLGVEHAKDIMSRMVAVFPGQRVIITSLHTGVQVGFVPG